MHVTTVTRDGFTLSASSKDGDAPCIMEALEMVHDLLIGFGPVTATRLTWGDVFMAYYSTGIPNIQDYLVLPESTRRQLAKMDYLRPLFRMPMLRNLLKRGVRPGPSAEKRARTVTHVWGEVNGADFVLECEGVTREDVEDV